MRAKVNLDLARQADTGTRLQYLLEFETYLIRRGFSRSSIQNYRGQARHFSGLAGEHRRSLEVNRRCDNLQVPGSQLSVSTPCGDRPSVWIRRNIKEHAEVEN